MMEQPSERQARILALVVREYVETAQPVSSERLVRRHELGVSPATVRHDLAALEELGLLTHPHTSAGRQPTVAGYRYFVEHLMLAAGLSEHERLTIRHQFHQAGWDPDRWMRLAAAVMAQTSGLAGLVATPAPTTAQVRRVELVDTGLGSVQVVVIMTDGMVRQARWQPGLGYDQADLDGIANRINVALSATGAMPAAGEGATSLADAGGAVVQDLMQRDAEHTHAPRVYHAGLTHILDVPEFADSDRLRGVVELLEHGLGLEHILERLPPRGVHVIIGGEPPLDSVPEVTLVLAQFGTSATPGGVLGIVGPTRLPYERAVPTVHFVARLMTRLLAGQEGGVAV